MTEALVVKVPEERVAVFIGKHGKTKKELEDILGVKLIIKGNEVHILGDAFHVFRAEPVIKAIARGFSPERAKALRNEEMQLEIIDLKDFYNTKNAITRIKGRIIGREGKIRKELERLTDSEISVYGHTVAVIAPYYLMPYIKEALSMLIGGAKHSTVFNFLSRVKGEMTYLRLKGDKI